MTEAVICAVIAGLAAVVVGIINALSQNKTKQDLSAEFQRKMREESEKEEARKEFEVHMIKGIMASNTLGEATARAVQRIGITLLINEGKSSHSKGTTEIISDSPLDEVVLKEAIGMTGYKVLNIQSTPYEKKRFSLFSKTS
ncbi:MAG: hypothetical protein VZR54_09920 [Ruminococcus sp.]|nr:hypothetical protein [Ruminococcus sp.]